MNLRRASSAGLAVLGLVVTGCGEEAGERPDHFDFAPSRTCLKQEDGVRVTTRGLDFVASTALGGGMRVTLRDNFVVLAFGETREEAERIETAYRNFAGERIPIDDVLKRDQNVVMVWNAPPSPEDDGRVRGCLRAAD